MSLKNQQAASHSASASSPHTTYHTATIYLLRHGEVSPKGLLCGATDIALSVNGINQLTDVISKLPAIDLCFSSPLSRCLTIAEKVSADNNPFQEKAAQLSVLAKLQEMNFGDWDGKPYNQLWQNSNSSEGVGIGDFWQNPWQVTPPNGESMVDFSKRVTEVWQQILTSSQGKTALVITHGGVIKQILAQILGLEKPSQSHLNHIKVDYAGIVKISVHYDDETQGGGIWPSICF